MGGWKIRNLIIGVLPISTFLIGLAILQLLSPVFSGPQNYDSDPAYVYLFNGLMILSGYSPYHIDHPGTPLQIVIAMIFALEGLISGTEKTDIVIAVLTNPEHYIPAICTVLLSLVTLAVFLIGRAVYRCTNSFSAAIICQSSPLLYGILIPRIVYLSPESLLIFLSLILMYLFVPHILLEGNEQEASSKQVAVAAGVVCGIGVAVKITFLPLVIMLLLLPSRRLILIALRATIISLIVCLLPIAAHAVRFYERILSFGLHSGKYGAGEANVIDISAIPERLFELWNIFPFYFVVLFLLALVISLGTLFRSRFNSVSTTLESFKSASNRMDSWLALHRLSLRVLLILLMAGVAQVILVLKHPGARYMVPSLPLANVALVYLLLAFDRKRIGSVLMCFALCATMVSQTAQAYNNLLKWRLDIDKTRHAIEEVLDEHTEKVVVGTYRCILPECGVAFGFSYAPQLRKIAPEIQSDFYDFNIWNRKIFEHKTAWTEIDKLDEFIRLGRTVLLVSPSAPSKFPEFNLERLFENEYQFLYRVISVR